MRTVIKNKELYENGKVIQEKIFYDDVKKRYYHERYENGRKVQEWTSEA